MATAKSGTTIRTDHFVTIPGVVVGLNLACNAFGHSGDGVIMQPPLYPPFLSAPGNAGCDEIFASLELTAGGYEIDFDAFERAITPRTRLFML